MEDILVMKENGLFHADITDEFKEERIIIYARTKEDFIDLIKKEIDFRRHLAEICWGKDDEFTYKYYDKWAKTMHYVLAITDFM